MPKRLTNAERLDLLLDWVNDDDFDVPYRGDLAKGIRRWRDELPHRLRRFVASFDGSEDAGFVRAEVATPEDRAPEDRAPAYLTPEELRSDLDADDLLARFHLQLGDILQRGFPNIDPAAPDLLCVPSLEFGIDRPKIVKHPIRKRLADRTGTYVMRVVGPELDLVLWLVMHLLTLPGAIVLRRCDALRSLSSEERCGRFYIRSDGPGRPKECCSDICRSNRFWEKDRKKNNGKAARGRRERRMRKGQN